MVDSKEKYKFDVGVEGLRWFVINQTYHLKRTNSLGGQSVLVTVKFTQL